MEMGALQRYRTAAASTLSEEMLRRGLEILTMKKALDSRDFAARALIQSMDTASSALRDTLPLTRGRVVDIRV